jgi:putative DNA primase/helicase
MARLIARAFANQCPEPRQKSKVASAKTVAAIERLARADRLHAATVDEWDSDRWIFEHAGRVRGLAQRQPAAS